MFCSKCGTESPDGAKFCSKCGAGLGAAATPTEDAAQPEAESSTGMPANVAGLLCYLFFWITGIIFVAIEKKSTFVRFHAWQSIITFAAIDVLALILGVLSIIPVVGLLFWVLMVILLIARFILWIILMVQAGTGKMWKVPLAGDWAEKQAGK